MRNEFTHQTSRITDFQMHGVRNSRNGRIAVTSFTVDGQHAMPTRSFWNWLIRKFAEPDNLDTCISDECISDLDEAEFWNRLQRQQPKAEIDYEIVWDDDGNAMLRAPLERIVNEPAAHNRISHLTNPDTDRLFMPSTPGTLKFSLN